MIRSAITYRAKRSLTAGHVAETSYTIELDIADAVPSVEDVKESERSQGGATETTFYRQDKFWKITFAPVRGQDLLLLRELLDSTESGQAFEIYLYGDEPQSLILKRLETGHSESAFLRVGSREGDYFQASITAIEVIGEAESTDIYAPEVGGPMGGLDPLPEPDFEITAAAYTESGYNMYGYRRVLVGSERGSIVSESIPGATLFGFYTEGLSPDPDAARRLKFEIDLDLGWDFTSLEFIDVNSITRTYLRSAATRVNAGGISQFTWLISPHGNQMAGGSNYSVYIEI